MRRLASFAGVIGVALAVASPFLLSGGDVLGSLSDVTVRAMLILTLVATVSALAKALKLHILMRRLGQPLGFFHTLAISLATDFAFLASPAGAAGYAVNVALFRRAGAPWSVATTVVGVDQALDLMFFAVAVPIAVFFSLGQLARILPDLSGSAYLIMLIAFVVTLVLLWQLRHRLFGSLHRLMVRTPWLRTRQQHLQQFLHDVRGQLQVLLRGDRLSNSVVLLSTVVQWLLRYGALWFALSELGHHLPLSFLLVLQAVVLHVAQWTGIPAGGGGADLGLAVALAPWVSAKVMATVLLLWRFSTLYVPLLIGMLSLVALFGNWRAARDFDRATNGETR